MKTIIQMQFAIRYVLVFALGVSFIQGNTQVRVPFTQRASAFTPTQTIYNINGDFTMIGNTNMTLQNYSATGLNSNQTMIKVDADGISSTNNSSSATLSFSSENGANPTCSNILFAGLYWSARTDGTPTEAQKRSIKFRGPGESAYTSYSSTVANIRYPGDDNMYVGFVEVTSQVQQRGLGEYWAADMALTTGNGGSAGYYGGWGLVVVYENSKMNKRDITLFDGYAYVVGGTAQWELPVTGINTALSGNVNVKLGMMAGEGDVTITGDKFEIQKLNTSNYELLSYTGNSTTNFFNSTINTGGNSRNPNLVNNTGMDITMFNIPNPSNSVIANGQTNTKFRYSSTQDTYIIYSICMAVDAYEPVVEGFLSTVSVNNLPVSSQNLTVLPGDEIKYKVQIRNRGNEAINNAKLEIPLPYAAIEYSGSTTAAFSPASSNSVPYVDATQGANGTLIWNFGTLPVPANPNTVLGELVFTLRVSQDCDLYRGLGCVAPGVQIDGTITGVGANTNIVINDQPFYVGFSEVTGCSTEPVTGPFDIAIDATSWVNSNCPAGDGIREFTYCSRTQPIPVTDVLGFYPAGTRFFNSAQTVEYTTANPFPILAGPTTYVALVPGSSCVLNFTIEVTNITSLPSVSSGVIEFCQNELATALSAILSNPENSLFFYAPGSTAAQPLLIPSTEVAGDFIYQVAEGSSSTCISLSRVNIPVRINPQPQISAIANQIMCFGQTGSVALVASGGTGVLRYSLSNPGTSELTAGTYTYTVSDGRGCSNSATAIINPAPEQPAAPSIECYETATWNASTCSWDVTGTQPEAPVTACYESVAFNTATCSWNVTGTQPAQPSIECWESATFNNSTCSWDVTGTQSAQPSIECWESASFNNSTCSWDVTGTQPAQPSLECWESATFNNSTCSWDVIGTQPAQPSIECWESASFNNSTCSWDVTGTQPAQPSLECWESASFNNSTCSWDVTGTQPAQPSIECWESATFNNSTCSWDVTGTQPAQPSIECWESASFNNSTCSWDVTGTQPAQPSIECWESASFNNSTCSWDVTENDNTLPVISQPGANATIECPNTPEFTAPTAVDACGEVVVQVVSDVTVNGACSGTYTRTISWKAVDNSGNESPIVSQTITVVDTEAPVIGALNNLSVSCGDAVQFDQPVVTDNCDADVQLTYADVTSEGRSADDNDDDDDETDGSAGAQNCDYTTYSKGGWGSPSNSTAGQYRDNNFASAFPNGLTIGCAVGSYTFTSAQAIEDFLPSGGGSAVLPAGNVVNPNEAVVSNNFADQLIAATLNTAFDAIDENLGDSDVNLGDLEFASGTFAGMTANEVIAIANNAIGGCGSSYSNTVLSSAMEAINLSFHEGGASSGALACSSNDNDNACTYDVTRTWTATDACGNTSTASQVITLVDDVAPVITVVASVDNNANLGGNPTAEEINAALGSATATDNCDSDVVVGSNDSPVTIDGCLRSQSRSFRAIDDCGNSSLITRSVSYFVDLEAPVVSFTCDTLVETVEGAVDLGCNPSNDQITTALCTITLTDNCDEDAEYTVNYTDTVIGEVGCVYTITRGYTATDRYGNTSTGSRTLSYKVDLDAPVIVATGTVVAGDNLGGNPTAAEIDAALGTATAEDFCDGELPVITTDEAVVVDGCNYSQTRIFSAMDECGNETSTSRTIAWFADLEAPVIVFTCDTLVETVEGALDLGCNPTSSEITNVLCTVTLNDNCDEDAQYTINYTDTTTSEVGCIYTITRGYTATDRYGNTSTGSRTLSYKVDLDAPVIVATGTVVDGDNLGGNPTAAEIDAALGTATAEDFCDGELPVITTDEPVIVDGCNYSQTRIFSAMDECGNETSTSRTIAWFVDLEAPVIVFTCDTLVEIVEGSLDLGCNPSSSEITNVLCTVTLIDNCDEDAQYTINYTDTTTSEVGCIYTITRGYTATDRYGNTSTGSRTLSYKIDLDAPVITATGPVENGADLGCNPSADDIDAALGTATAEDFCDGELPVITNDEAVVVDGCNYSQTRIFSALDECGNETSTSRTIVWKVDNTAPVFDPYTIYLGMSCTESEVYSGVTATDNCGDVSISHSDMLASGGCLGTIIRTYSALDACGNSASTQQFISIQDHDGPVIENPANATVDCSEAPASIPSINIYDECGYEVTVLEASQNIVTIDECSYQIIWHWEAIDFCENVSEATTVITVTDNINPWFTNFPADLNISCDEEIPAVVYPEAYDNCTLDLTIYHTDDIIPGACANSYSISRMFRVFDNCGNSALETQTITVSDETAPMFGDNSSNYTYECNTEIPVIQPSASDNCSENLTYSYADGGNWGNSCESGFTRTWTVTDECGNSSTFAQSITIVDTTAPVISGQFNIQRPCTDYSGTYVSASDNCNDVNITYNDEMVSGSCAGSILRTYTATDLCGNSSTFTQNIGLTDDVAPVIESETADFTVECDVEYNVAAPSFSDNCDNDLDITSDVSSSTDGCTTVVTYTWTATDHCDNSTTSTTVVTIVDTTLPTFTYVPGDATYECTEEPVLEMATASDNCDSDVEVSVSSVTVAGSCPSNYQIIRTFTAIDNCGNPATSVQTITVQDTQSPVFGDNQSSFVYECSDETPVVTPSVSDACSEVTLTYSDGGNWGTTCNYGFVRTWTATDACGNASTFNQNISYEDTTAPVVNPYQVQLSMPCNEINYAVLISATDNCSEVNITYTDVLASGGCPGVIIRTYSISDECGNITEGSYVQYITLTDLIAPVVANAPQDVTIECGNDYPAYSPQWSDNCDDNLTITSSSSISVLGCTQIITEIYSAEDHCENVTTVTRTITIVDTTAPEFNSLPGNASYDCGDNIPVASVSASDVCDENVEVSYNDAVVAGDCPANYTIVRTWTAVDCSGNSATHVQYLSVSDTHAPEFGDNQSEFVYECGDNAPVVTPSVSDDCSQLSLSYSDDNWTEECVNGIVRTWTAVDACGNTSYFAQSIRFEDNTEPELSGCPSDQVLACTDELPAPAVVTVSDACDSDVEVVYEEFVYGDLPAAGSIADCDLMTPVRPANNPCAYPADWAMSLFGMPSAYRWYNVSAGNLVQYPNGTIQLTATLNNVNNAANGWNLSVTFAGGMNWEQWSSQGFPTGFKADCGGEAANHTDWTYFLMQAGAGAEMTGFGAYAGSALNLVHAPDNNYFGFQLGDGANNYNGAENGFGGWFSYNGTFLVNNEPVFSGSATGAGDLAFELDCCPDYYVVRQWTATDCSGNMSSCSQTITFEGSMGPQGMNDGGLTEATEVRTGSMVSVAPNPASVKTLFTFVPANTGVTFLEIYDITGNKVADVFSGKVDAGIQYRVDYDVNALPTGVYMFRMTNGSEVFTDRLIINK